MFSLFKKKIIVPHVRLTGVIGSAGRFRQGIDLYKYFFVEDNDIDQYVMRGIL